MTKIDDTADFTHRSNRDAGHRSGHVARKDEVLEIVDIFEE